MNDNLGNFFYYTICTSWKILTTNNNVSKISKSFWGSLSLAPYSNIAKTKTIQHSLDDLKYNLMWKVHYE